MIRTRKAIPAVSHLELTALLDIVFIVVVFLLLTANSRLLPLPVDLPAADNASATASQRPATLTITLQQQAPVWSIDQQGYADWESFRSALQAQLASAPASVNIATARDAEVESLLRLLAFLRREQVVDTQILMDSES